MALRHGGQYFLHCGIGGDGLTARFVNGTLAWQARGQFTVGPTEPRTIRVHRNDHRRPAGAHLETGSLPVRSRRRYPLRGGAADVAGDACPFGVDRIEYRAERPNGPWEILARPKCRPETLYGFTKQEIRGRRRPRRRTVPWVARSLEPRSKRVPSAALTPSISTTSADRILRGSNSGSRCEVHLERRNRNLEAGPREQDADARR